jgi:hypothetical protein
LLCGRLVKRRKLNSLISLSLSLSLRIYADASYAPSALDRKSISGYVATIGGATVEWGSCKQTIAVTSTSEAEYIAMAHCSNHLQHFRQLLVEIGVHTERSAVPVIYSDNQSAIAVLSQINLGTSSRHIDIKYHVVRDKITTVLVDKTRKWTTFADMIVKAYNDTPHDVTKFPPRYLLKGEKNQPFFCQKRIKHT